MFIFTIVIIIMLISMLSGKLKILFFTVMTFEKLLQMVNVSQHFLISLQRTENSSSYMQMDQD